ncbi:MAG TPA: AAA family ATPase [Baekduia sp.]|uniref:AAA family ATPase n=1 Tax=Baekduia sp. TaxID=2600305 RepID=UPI002C968F47|nr:AAA family ATPase [Baekduia sp.]HMJ35976.1 AAA family ATPase [Baekduia sp.]
MGSLETGALVGRRVELQRLAAVVDGRPAGRGAALVVEGPPGVGKSALLAAIRPAGGTVLSATGAETEIDLPFAGLAELLHPVLGRLDALAPVQRAALRGALALDAPAPVQDRGLVLHAFVALLRAVTQDGPLLLCVDDVQWLDPSSQEAVAFAARRAERLGVAVVVVRSLRGAPVEPWPGVPRLVLGDLARADALALARARGVTPAVAETLVDALGGNPLALTEAPAQLTADQRAGRAALPEPLPAGERLQRAYAERLAELPAPARRALVLLAASGDGAAGPLAAALGAGMVAFGPAEEAGLVAVAPRQVRFTHPLVRTAVLQDAGAAARRAAHRALAETVPEHERAWHRAAAADAPDEELASALEAHGHDARERGAPATAALVFERAAALSPARGAATARTLAAAAMATVAGRPAAAKALLDALLPSIDDPLARADVQLLRGMAMQHIGRPMAAYALLEQEADRVVARDPARAAGLLTQAGVALVAHGTVSRLAALAERAVALAPPGGELIPAVLHASALASLGEHARARAMLRERAPALAALDPTGPGHEILSVAALCHVWMEDYEDAERLLTWLVDTSRARGAIGALPFPLSVLAGLHLRRGSFAEADALTAEAVGLGEEAVGSFLHSVALVNAAFAAAHRGDAEACSAHAGQGREIAQRLELTSTLACAEQALGFLALGSGDAPAAVRHLERAREHTQRLGSRDPSFLYTGADLAEAYARVGRVDEAAELADELAAGAEATGSAWAAAAAARCRALTGPDQALDAHLAVALAAHARVPLRFELARTRLCFGERLRRARRRADAREHLTAAHETFVALGAPHWARRAEQELAATGARRGAASGRASDAALTAREREVCRLVAGGATNAEAAAALFLSARTVEHHLRMAYRKLGVRSRSELTAHVVRLGER